MSEAVSCPYIVDVPGIVSMKGCKLTEVREGRKSYFTLCSPTCYESDYTKCPTYQNREMKK